MKRLLFLLVMVAAFLMPTHKAEAQFYGDVPPPAYDHAYRVRPGDNLWDISERLTGDGFRYKELLPENRWIQDPWLIYPGTYLTLPDYWPGVPYDQWTPISNTQNVTKSSLFDGVPWEQPWLFWLLAGLMVLILLRAVFGRREAEQPVVAYPPQQTCCNGHGAQEIHHHHYNYDRRPPEPAIVHNGDVLNYTIVMPLRGETPKPKEPPQPETPPASDEPAASPAPDGDPAEPTTA